MGDMTVIHLPALYSLLYLLWPLCVSYSLAQVWSKERVKERRNSSHAVPGTDVVLFPWESQRTCPLYHSVKNTTAYSEEPGTFLVPIFALGADRPQNKDIALCIRLVPWSECHERMFPHTQVYHTWKCMRNALMTIIRGMCMSPTHRGLPRFAAHARQQPSSHRSRHIL